MTKAFDNLFWHDGNLVEINFAIDSKGKSSLEITVLLYKDEQASSTEAYQIKCSDVSRFNSSLDATELRVNAFAGNISHGYLKEKVLWIYFTDGLIEVHAKRFQLVKC